MLALLFIAGPLAASAFLLGLRSEGGLTLAARADRFTAGVMAALSLGLIAGWPSASVRSWFGLVAPAACADKAKVRQAPVVGGGDFEQLKRELRLDDAAGPPPGVEARATQALSRVTGPGSPGRTLARWDVGGTDLGHPFVLDGRLGLVFGDTFPQPVTEGPGRRSNVLAWIDERAPGQLVVTDMRESGAGGAGEVLGSLKIPGWEVTVIPTNSVAIDGTVVLHWMSVACWGAPGDWTVREAGLAASFDGGEQFHRIGPTWAGDSGFAQVAFVTDDEWLYAFGIPEGREGGALLARVPRDGVFSPSAWTYWDGAGWTRELADASIVVAPPVGELSVAWVERHGVWLMMYLEEIRGGIVLRTAPELTGPWSRPRLVVSLVEHPQAYAPFLLPQLEDSPWIQFTMSRYDIYNVLLMETCLESLGSSTTPTPTGDAGAAPERVPCPGDTTLGHEPRGTTP